MKSDTAYKAGFEFVLTSAGVNKADAGSLATKAASVRKQAAFFNFSDSQNDYPHEQGGSSFSKYIIPALAVLAAGTIGYKSGINGNKDWSAFTNIKNYLGNTARKLVRKTSTLPAYDISAYTHNLPDMKRGLV